MEKLRNKIKHSHKKKILVGEDLHFCYLEIKDFLEINDDSYEITYADNFNDFANLAKTEKFDLIICDNILFKDNNNKGTISKREDLIEDTWVNKKTKFFILCDGNNEENTFYKRYKPFERLPTYLYHSKSNEEMKEIEERAMGKEKVKVLQTLFEKLQIIDKRFNDFLR